MDKIQQIKTYIQNQKKEWRKCQSSEAEYRIEAIDEFLEVIKVINSLPEGSFDYEHANIQQKDFASPGCLMSKICPRYDQEEPVNEDLEKEIKRYQQEDYDRDTTVKDVARHFANWQQEQFEQNRLKACDSQTKEEAEREWNFVEHMIKDEHRQPTYSDAIEYGMKLQKDKDDRDLLMSDNRNFDKCYELGKKDMKEEMMKDALDADITDGGITKSLRVNTKDFLSAWDKYEVGTKLKLIFIKEDIL